MSGPTPLTYNGFVTALSLMLVTQVHTVAGVVVGNQDPAFDLLIPQALNYAEDRICRDLDFIQTQAARSYTLTANNNQLTIPQTDFVTLQTITTASGPVLPVSKEYIQNVWGSVAGAAVPTVFAMYGGDTATGGNTSTNIIFGPWPDSAYPITVTGTIRPPSLNTYNTDPTASTTTTFISSQLPDLLLQAAMIIGSQYQRNLSGASNDPALPGSYENQYQNLLKGSIVEEARKKFQSSAWSSYSPALVASAGR